MVKASRAASRGARYCSLPCHNAAKRGSKKARDAQKWEKRACKLCGATFAIRRAATREQGYGTFCSRRCTDLFARTRRGEHSPKWKGGRDRKRQHLMQHAQYKDWRAAVFARDDYTCRDCGVRGGTLNAHHRLTWRAHPDLRYDVSNGVTLCVPCHKAVHRGSASSS
jgi:5-methylcytosine-specific restriction endonuclease McrA